MRCKVSQINLTGAELPAFGFMRLPAVLAAYPVSRSTWWAGVKTGRYPQPIKLGLRVTAWRVEDIRALIEKCSEVEDSQ